MSPGRRAPRRMHDESGNALERGMYFIRLSVDDQIYTRTLMVSP